MRVVLSSIAGVLVAGLTVAVIEVLGSFLFPPPPELDVHNANALAAWVVAAPPGMLALLILAWALGPLVGCVVGTGLGRSPVVAYVVGSVALAATLVNLAELPHPLWMWPAGVIAVFAGTIAGGALGMRLPKLI